MIPTMSFLTKDEKRFNSTEKELFKTFKSLPLFLQYVLREQAVFNFKINDTVKGSSINYYLVFDGNFTVYTKEYPIMSFGIDRKKITSFDNGVSFHDFNNLRMELSIHNDHKHLYIQWLLNQTKP